MTFPHAPHSEHIPGRKRLRPRFPPGRAHGKPPGRGRLGPPMLPFPDRSWHHYTVETSDDLAKWTQHETIYGLGHEYVVTMRKFTPPPPQAAPAFVSKIGGVIGGDSTNQTPYVIVDGSGSVGGIIAHEIGHILMNGGHPDLKGDNHFARLEGVSQ